MEHLGAATTANPTTVTETTPLLLGEPIPDPESAEIKPSEPGSWQQETKVILRYSAPLALALLLQYALTTSSIFVVGHLGKREIGAVSLANMTATITGYTVYQGFSTCLDTLCPQAYGCGKKTLVGLHLQRLTMLLLLLTVPIAALWLNADRLFALILPAQDDETALLAGLYLKILLFGAPGYACFEAGKRFLQAQGMFAACLFILLVCTAFNAFMGWLFVWKLNWGFIGAPIAVAITNNLLPILLALYVYLIRGRECWHPLSGQVWQNWGPMMRLALPSWLMMEAEFIVWELLTLASSHLGPTELAAQSALMTVSCFAFYIGFAVSVAGGTHIAILVGAGALRRAAVATRVVLCLALTIGSSDLVLLILLRHAVPVLFSNNPQVCHLITYVLPLCALLQIPDAFAASLNGVLRALGRPDLGSYVQIPVYYILAFPLSLGLAFGMDWGLIGLWAGLSLGQVLNVLIEGGLLWFLLDWEKAAREASTRNLLP
ncbi:hypothetical protein N7510_002415 [Penicillium lagena]|uniref:uncharacterized protein n=1 Tax=Penicillium lagena TaxID=94218 RepID=UPI002540E5D5|nr:uncharacterized protein N7510_002415 [Penicillium lagena]KAJ5626106.1 hypothetical protein N7510_002415 [Penicillium lagena]